MLMASLATTDKLSISTVLPAEPRLMAPATALSTTLPAAASEAIEMPPVLEVKVISPATPVMLPMVMLPSASMATLPPPKITSSVRFKAPACTTVRSPGRVMTTFMVPTSLFRLRLPPTSTSSTAAVTVPPRVTPPEASKSTRPVPVRPTLMGDTTTRSLLVVPVSSAPATSLISSLAPVCSDTKVKLPLAAKPKLPGVRAGMTRT